MDRGAVVSMYDAAEMGGEYPTAVDLSRCDCGTPIHEHVIPWVLDQHDFAMRKATIERLRATLSRIGVLDGMPWFRVDAALTDEEVGR